MLVSPVVRFSRVFSVNVYKITSNPFTWVNSHFLSVKHNVTHHNLLKRHFLAEGHDGWHHDGLHASSSFLTTFGKFMEQMQMLANVQMTKTWA
jgi:hypothetical protein